MRRAQPPVPINGKLYRHFAVVTVVLTLLIAVFASGENREVIETAIAKKQMHSKSHKAQADKVVPGSSMRDGRTGQNSWAGWEITRSNVLDSGGSNSASNAQSADAAPAVAPRPSNCAAMARNIGPTGIASGSQVSGAPLPGSLAALRKGPQQGCTRNAAPGSAGLAANVPPPAPRENQMTDIVAASRERSGSTGSGD